MNSVLDAELTQHAVDVNPPHVEMVSIKDQRDFGPENLDGSTDHTSDIAKRAGARGVRHEKDKGKGAACADDPYFSSLKRLSKNSL